jgi:UPF0755 protein
MTKKQWWIIVLLLLVSVFVGFASAYRNFLNIPIVQSDKPLDYVLKPGASIRILANDLHKLGVLPQPEFLVVLAYQKGVTKKLKAGEYLFAPGTTPVQLLNMIAAGNVRYHKFTLIEGWNFQQVLAAINADPHLVHTINNLTSIQVAEKINLPPNNPEGLFFPATYYFTTGTKDVDLLRRANQTMTQQLAQAWNLRAQALPYKNSYEALIAASLVEKETAVSSERPLIAGVINNRLLKNMPLQIDSTVVYGVGQNYSGKLSVANLKLDTPYNTYTRRGLPPTPIAMPSGEAIRAVLHPVNTDYLYFVAKGNGSHQFSQTLGEHKVAVNVYQISFTFPKIGKLYNSFNCRKFWYAGVVVQSLLGNRCVLR